MNEWYSSVSSINKQNLGWLKHVKTLVNYDQVNGIIQYINCIQLQSQLRHIHRELRCIKAARDKQYYESFRILYFLINVQTLNNKNINKQEHMQTDCFWST